MLRAVLTFAASTLVMASVGNAEIVSIPAAAFSPNNPGLVEDFGAVDEGVFKPATEIRLIAPVDFPKNGQKICKMTLVHADENTAEDFTMQLLRKTAVVGAFANATPPKVVAELTSSGDVDTIRKASTTNISPRTVNDKTGFYYLQTDFVNFDQNIVGVQFDVRSKCP